MSLEYWKKIHRSIKEITPGDAQWLDRYADIFVESGRKNIIDLGCGSGAESIHLLNSGYPVISCDFSGVILDKLASFNKRIITEKFDFQHGFPFENGDAHVIVASLSLHYFDWETTREIVAEVGRVLDDNGCLICRLNSTKDVNHGAGRGIELEKNFYEIDGNRKRFFDRAAIDDLFSGWETVVRRECVILRFKQVKKAWEVVVRKR
ncbi:MAG: class I SAM-dependent methyltransferase [Chitinispirillaceae bacterium]|nr:class I SAM-dependent methyltransferase [Chitinispirillaceae bacterium]